MPGRPDDTVDPEFLGRLLATISVVDDLANARRAALHRKPARGSAAKADTALASGELVFVFATQALGFAIDHLKAWESLILGGLHPTFAQMTLLRAALEGAATARWLLDLEVTPTERVGRGIASAVDDLIQVRRFELSVGRTSSQPKPGEAVDARIADLKRVSLAAGIPEVRYPAATTLFETYGGDHGDGVWLFRLVSAFAHAKQWAIAGTDRDQRSASYPPGVEGGHVTSSDQVVLFATTRTVDLVRTALDDLDRYGTRRSVGAWFRGP